MCGLIGGKNTALKQSSLEFLEHRGPDDSGWFEDGEVVLGHTRLSIQDLSSFGSQPVVSSDGSVVLVYNGEIYNVAELRRILVDRGVEFEGSSDTEVLLHLYLWKGKDILREINGIYAFAFWDKRKEEFWLARDEFGIKPLYYYMDSERFIFSSELKAISQISFIDRKLDAEALAGHLSFLWTPSPRTLFTNIQKLKPGHHLTYRMGNFEIKSFYRIPYNGTKSISEEKAIAKTQTILRESVHEQLISDAPVGCFLSGGLDSSAVTAFAREKMGKELPVFTIDLQDDYEKSEGMESDLPYAQTVAKHLGLELNVVSVTSDILSNFEKMIYHLDEPVADPSAINVMLICQAAKSAGIKVLLSGVGGDDLFTGYRRHQALMIERFWATAPQTVRHLMAYTGRKLPASNLLFRRIKKALFYADQDPEKRLVSYFFWAAPNQVFDILSDRLKNELSDFDFYRGLLESLTELNENLDPINKMLFLEKKHFLADHNLNYTDKMSMSEGVEVRVPFVNKTLVEHACSLPINYKIRGNISKWVLKKAMEGILPNEVIYRSKTGFGAPVRYWLKKDLKPLVDELLSKRVIMQRDLFNYDRVQELRKADSNGTIDAAYTLFQMMCIEQWCRIFLDRK